MGEVSRLQAHHQTSALSIKFVDTRRRYSACIPSRPLENIVKNYWSNGKHN